MMRADPPWEYWNAISLMIGALSVMIVMGLIVVILKKNAFPHYAIPKGY